MKTPINEKIRPVNNTIEHIIKDLNLLLMTSDIFKVTAHIDNIY
jgi:hypothetical protein